MTTHTTCPGCHKRFNVPTRLVGSGVRCKVCQHKFIVKDDRVPTPEPEEIFLAEVIEESPQPQLSDDGWSTTEPEPLPSVALRACPSCGQIMPTSTVICMNCGFDLRHQRSTVSDAPLGTKMSGIAKPSHPIGPSSPPRRSSPAAVVILLLLIAGYAFYWATEHGVFDQRLSSDKPHAGLHMLNIGAEYVDFAKFQTIQPGMSYRQVVDIIGHEGEEMSRGRIDGIPGVMDPVETVMYQWVNGNGSNMNALFQNDNLKNKAQFGLR